MKVLHVIPSMSPVHGGATSAIEAMARALSAQQVEVDIAATDDDGPGRRLAVQCGTPLLRGAVRHWYFGKRTEFYKVSPSFARWIAGSVRRFDVIHIHAAFSFTSTAAVYAARWSRVPYVLHPVGTLNTWGLEQRRPWLKKASLATFELPALRHAARVHFTSEDEAGQVRQLRVPMREAIIPLGVEPPATPRLRDAAPRRLLFLSRLDPKKNVEGLLQGFAIVRQSHPGLSLVIAGSGPDDYVRSLHSMASALGLAGSVAWPGHVSGHTKARLFDDSDIFILPSFSENFGVAAVEALASGLPCVLGAGVAVASEIELAGAGIQVATNPGAIARGVESVIARGQQISEMSRNALALARDRYSLEKMGCAMKQLYADIVSDVRPRTGVLGEHSPHHRGD
jgi:glycosyltransferase involved in cell wall biosynthesis